ncbi:MAG: PKD domain-containing protein, partial [Candidatus Woesearchaeota archaeon]
MNRIAVFTLLVLASIATVAATPSFSIEPASGTVPLDVSYACSAPAQAFPPVTHVISFGDGHQTTQASGSYRYTDVGTFTAKCVVYDLLGDRYESSKTVRVEPRSGPKPTLSVSPTSGRVPLDVSYSCTSEGGVAPVTYVVSFGDGHQTTKASGTHRYTDDGTFEVTCTAYDLLGDTGTARKTVVVEAPHTFDSISFSVSPTSGRVPLDVSYSCSAVGGTAPVSYVISFGDGHQTTQASGSYRYTDVGTFTATCTAYDLLGDKISATRTIRVDPPIQPLQVSYSVSPSSGDAPLSTQHSCSVSGGVAPYSYTITTGDGRTISASSASHVYHDAGSYVARCSVTDSKGSTASRTRTVTVSEPVVPKDPLGVSLSV